MAPPGPDRTVVVVTDDPLILQRLDRLAREFGLRPAGDPGDRDPQGEGEAPYLFVIDLERPGAVDRVRGWRGRHPQVLIAAHLASPRRDLWLEAERAGCDLVANRGSFALRLRRLLEAPAGPAERLFPLFEVADGAGRLGLVFRTDDTPVGPIAVYRTGGALHAAADRCPHAGATLSDGELEGAVVTCPRHGSRFDVRTGERLRGPADLGLATYRLVEDGGRVHLLLEPS